MSDKISDKISEKVKDVAPMRKLADTELRAVCGGVGNDTNIVPDAGRRKKGGGGGGGNGNGDGGGGGHRKRH